MTSSDKLLTSLDCSRCIGFTHQHVDENVVVSVLWSHEEDERDDDHDDQQEVDDEAGLAQESGQFGDAAHFGFLKDMRHFGAGVNEMGM